MGAFCTPPQAFWPDLGQALLDGDAERLQADACGIQPAAVPKGDVGGEDDIAPVIGARGIVRVHG